MQVVVPRKDMHFDSSTTSTPYVSAPTSPKRFVDDVVGPFDYYCHYSTASAPTSPARAAAIYAASVVPFDWEETPGTPKSPAPNNHNDDRDDDDDVDDYVFEFSGQLEKGVLPPELAAADELFEEGKIRPLKPPPRLYNLNPNDDRKSNMNMASSSSRSPRSSSKGGLWSPRHKKKHGGSSSSEGIDPFATAMIEATKERGREKGTTVPSPSPFSSSIPSSRSRKGSRSLSPMRGGGEFSGPFIQSAINSPSQVSTSAAAAAAAPSSSAKSKGGSWSKKWRLRDLLLFRSASEGRATGNSSKDPLRKFSIHSTSSSSPIKRGGEDSRNSSFRSTDSTGSSTSMRRGGSMSPHEMHYASNRAASEEMKRKTALPFGRQGLFGCLRFNPAVQSVARGLHNSSTFSHRRQL